MMFCGFRGLDALDILGVLLHFERRNLTAFMYEYNARDTMPKFPYL